MTQSPTERQTVQERERATMDNEEKKFFGRALATFGGLFGSFGAVWVLMAIVTVVVNLAFIGLLVAVVVMVLRYLGVAI